MNNYPHNYLQSNNINPIMNQQIPNSQIPNQQMHNQQMHNQFAQPNYNNPMLTQSTPNPNMFTNPQTNMNYLPQNTQYNPEENKKLIIFYKKC